MTMPRRRADGSIAAVYGAGQDRYLELIRRFPLRRLQSEADLDAAIRVVHDLIDQDALTPAEDDYLDVLSDLVEAYEEEHHPIGPVSDADMLGSLIESRGATQAAVAAGAGIAESTISEVLAGKRKLTRGQIGKLARYFKVDPGVFEFGE
jgi:HTH-type transcriptional regulator/antitoxin HigA